MKASVQEVASQAASKAKVVAAEKNVTPPTTAYQFEVSWRGLSGDSGLQASLLKSISPTALLQILKNASTVPVLQQQQQQSLFPLSGVGYMNLRPRLAARTVLTISVG
ncbi:hypothetical protein TB1_032591 [Malus domestica]